MENLKIVLVGPSKSQLEFSYDNLLSRSIPIKHYPSGEQALLNLAEDDPDVLVIDMDSTTVSPVGLCHTIKENSRFSDLPIVLVSGGGQMDPNLYFKGVDFMKKPFSKNELMVRLNLHKTLRDMCRTFKTYLKGL